MTFILKPYLKYTIWLFCFFKTLRRAGQWHFIVNGDLIKFQTAPHTVIAVKGPKLTVNRIYLGNYDMLGEHGFCQLSNQHDYHFGQ